MNGRGDLAYIMHWADVAAGQTVLVGDTYWDIEKIEGPKAGVLLVTAVMAVPPNTRREFMRQSYHRVPVLLSIADQARITAQYRKIFERNAGHHDQ